jgi:low affinity Fe/Cu permease
MTLQREQMTLRLLARIALFVVILVGCVAMGVVGLLLAWPQVVILAVATMVATVLGRRRFA